MEKGTRGVRERLLELMGGWDRMSGCGAEWMLYGIVCNHDDNVLCNHRQEYLSDRIIELLVGDSNENKTPMEALLLGVFMCSTCPMGGVLENGSRRCEHADAVLKKPLSPFGDDDEQQLAILNVLADRCNLSPSRNANGRPVMENNG